MSEDMIRYDLIVQKALLGAVRDILINAASDGLPGDHHFFITFNTTAPGVELSQRMRRQYPDEMTIVLQHQFWDLVITEDHFEVGLSFKNVPEKLSIPFHALTGFADPSVEFALRFDINASNSAQEANTQQDNQHQPSPAQLVAKDFQSDAADDESKLTVRRADGDDNENPDNESDEAATSGAKVVSIDAFRKRT